MVVVDFKILKLISGHLKHSSSRGDITTNIIEIKRTMRKYYEQLFANKLENLDKMNKFLGRHKLPKLTQAKIKKIPK